MDINLDRDYTDCTSRDTITNYSICTVAAGVWLPESSLNAKLESEADLQDHALVLATLEA